MTRRGPRSRSPGSQRLDWSVRAAGWILLLVAVVVVPSAASTFRLPKEAVVLAGLALVLAAELASRAVRGKLELPSGPLAWVVAVYPALLALSAAWAARPTWALGAAGRAAVWVAFILWAATLPAVARQHLARRAALGVAISALCLLLQAVGWSPIPLATRADGRFALTGLAGNPADLAMAAVLLLPLILPTRPEEGRRWQAWVTPAILAVAAAVTLTLSGLVALAALAGTWLVQQRSRASMLVVALGLVAALAAAGLTGLGDRLHNLATQLRFGNYYAILAARGDGWGAAAEMIRRHPAVGVGAAHFDHAFYPSRLGNLERRGAVGGRGEQATHFEWAHCDPLQVLAELGLVGGLWMLALVVTLVHGSPRGDPVLPLAAAAATPFLLLHYPGHIAGGLVPLALVLAHVLAAGPRAPATPAPWARHATAVLLAAAAVTVAAWQVARLELDIWFRESEIVLQASQRVPPARRAVMTTAVERQAFDRLRRSPAATPRLWRVIGRARLAREDAAAAEQGFRTALALWPHAEAELGLGLALARQGRFDEAVTHLFRVGRVNPSLTALLPEETLRTRVEAYLRAVTQP